MQPMFGMHPLTRSAVTCPEGPKGIDPWTKFHPAVPVGPPGIAPVAPSSVMRLQGLPSGLTHTGLAEAVAIQPAAVVIAAPASTAMRVLRFIGLFWHFPAVLEQRAPARIRTPNRRCRGPPL